MQRETSGDFFIFFSQLFQSCHKVFVSQQLLGGDSTSLSPLRHRECCFFFRIFAVCAPEMLWDLSEGTLQRHPAKFTLPFRHRQESSACVKVQVVWLRVIALCLHKMQEQPFSAWHTGSALFCIRSSSVPSQTCIIYKLPILISCKQIPVVWQIAGSKIECKDVCAKPCQTLVSSRIQHLMSYFAF